jgi:hypothetical protein
MRPLDSAELLRVLWHVAAMIPDPDQMQAWAEALHEFSGVFRELTTVLTSLQKGQVQIMAALDDLKAAEAQEETDLGQLVLTINTSITSLQAAASTERQLIADLTAKVNGGGAASAADLAALTTASQTRDATLKAMTQAVSAAAANLVANPPAPTA